MGKPPTTLSDIAKSLGTSIGTVHRALHDNPGVSPATKATCPAGGQDSRLQAEPCRAISSPRRRRSVSRSTHYKEQPPFGTKSAPESARKPKRSCLKTSKSNSEPTPSLGEGEEEAFEAAIQDKVDGIITFPSRSQGAASLDSSRISRPHPCRLRSHRRSQQRKARHRLRRHARQRFHRRRSDGQVPWPPKQDPLPSRCSTWRSLSTPRNTLPSNPPCSSFYPNLSLLKPIEDHDVEKEAYRKCRKLFEQYPDLAGIYVTTEASDPRLESRL